MSNEVKPDGNRMYTVVSWVVWQILRVVFRVKVTGVQNVPATGGFMLASNHASFFDPPILCCVTPRELSYFAKKELFRIPFVNFFLAVSQSIPVDRRGFSKSSLKTMVTLLKGGRGVGIFPEGTRTRTGEMGEPKLGAGMGAVEAEVPVVPCWIEGSFRIRPFLSQVTVHFLPPFDPRDIEAPSRKEHYLLVSERIMCDIRKLQERQMALPEQANQTL